ncbi:MAG: hypothetical protein QM783_08095 [Phycisphaerales bacterium]
MTHHDFNEKLLLAKDTALDTLEDLCAPAFPKRSRIPTTRDDGTLIPYDEQLAMSRLQPPRMTSDEQHIAVSERTQRMRAATTILKTRPIGEDGNPLPISRRHPEQHTRTTPRPDRDSTSPERERVGDARTSTNATEHAPPPTTDDAPRPEDARSQPAGGGSPAGNDTNQALRSGGPTNPPFDRIDIVTLSSALPGRREPHTPQPAGESGEDG